MPNPVFVELQPSRRRRPAEPPADRRQKPRPAPSQRRRPPWRPSHRQRRHPLRPRLGRRRASRDPVARLCRRASSGCIAFLDTACVRLPKTAAFGRLAQRESVPFTRERSQVQSLQRPPFLPHLSPLTSAVTRACRPELTDDAALMRPAGWSSATNRALVQFTCQTAKRNPPRPVGRPRGWPFVFPAVARRAFALAKSRGGAPIGAGKIARLGGRARPLAKGRCAHRRSARRFSVSGVALPLTARFQHWRWAWLSSR